MFRLGIDFLDEQIGGVPPSLIILLEEVGAGGREFMITSVAKNAAIAKYVAVAKSATEIERELRMTFPELKIEDVEVHSLAEYYFKDSVIPLRWVSAKVGLEILKGERDLLSKLVEVLDGFENCAVYLDSITDLSRAVGRRELVDLLKGLRSLCVRRNILAFALLTAGVLEKGYEEEILDQGDAVVSFELSVEKDSITRWMYFRKFLGVLPRVEREKIIRYSVTLDPAKGFTISRIMRVI